MVKDLKSKSVLIADNGLFTEIAPRLAREFGEVKFFSPWASAYPKAGHAHIGVGLPGVKRILSFWDHVPDTDLVVFPDLYFADAQKVVAEKFGKPVWGHRQAELLELDRIGTRRYQKEIGIGAPRTKVVMGVDELAAYLERSGPRWVKISCFRGDGETWQHTSWHVSKIYLDHFRNRVGALAERYEFMVEEPIEGIEIGYDGWTVNGAFPESAFWGIEIKDRGYAGVFKPYGEHPAALREVNDKMAPKLREEGAIGFCALECRIGKDRVARLIDPCMRACSPPFEATQEAYDNLGEVIWEGAHGRLAIPRALGRYVAMAMVHSSFALTNWVPIEVPEANRRWLKLRNVAELDGRLYHVPIGGEMPEIGSVVAVSDDWEEAKRLVRERAETVQAYNIEINVEALDTADEEIAKAQEYGVDFH